MPMWDDNSAKVHCPANANHIAIIQGSLIARIASLDLYVHSAIARDHYIRVMQLQCSAKWIYTFYVIQRN
ncbi:hypothetical protein D3C78_1864380 [compost metagenome]